MLARATGRNCAVPTDLTKVGGRQVKEAIERLRNLREAQRQVARDVEVGHRAVYTAEQQATEAVRAGQEPDLETVADARKALEAAAQRERFTREAMPAAINSYTTALAGANEWKARLTVEHREWAERALTAAEQARDALRRADDSALLVRLITDPRDPHLRPSAEPDRAAAALITAAQKEMEAAK